MFFSVFSPFLLITSTSYHYILVELALKIFVLITI